MATINFFIQSNNNPAGIYIRLRDGREVDLKAKTRYSIDPDQWSTAKGQPKNLKDAALKRLNEELLQFSADLLNHYNSSVRRETINTLWLKEFIKPTKEERPAVPEKLVDYFDFYGQHKKSSIQSSTYSKLNVNKHLLERFQKWAKTEFLVKDVNAEFKLKFEQFCQKNGYAPNTIARAIKFIKTICYHAAGHGVEAHYQLKNITARTVKVEKNIPHP
jgi:hypothetical protein